MRKIRNPQHHAADPSLMFARGVEQLVNDHLYHPARNDARKAREQRADSRADSKRGNIFNVLLRQFVF